MWQHSHVHAGSGGVGGPVGFGSGGMTQSSLSPEAQPARHGQSHTFSKHIESHSMNG